VRREAANGFVTRFSINAINGTSADRSRNKWAYKRYTSPETTLHAVRLAMTVGVTEAARRLKIKMETLRTWVKLRRPQRSGKYSGANLRLMIDGAREIYRTGKRSHRIAAMRDSAKALGMKWSSVQVHINMECVAVPPDWPIYQAPDAQRRMERLWDGTGSGSPISDATPYPASYFVAEANAPVRVERPRATEAASVAVSQPESAETPAFCRPNRTVAPK
jgi:hypothetical protein